MKFLIPNKHMERLNATVTDKNVETLAVLGSGVTVQSHDILDPGKGFSGKQEKFAGHLDAHL